MVKSGCQKSFPILSSLFYLPGYRFGIFLPVLLPAIVSTIPLPLLLRVQPRLGGGGKSQYAHLGVQVTVGVPQVVQLYKRTYVRRIKENILLTLRALFFFLLAEICLAIPLSY